MDSFLGGLVKGLDRGELVEKERSGIREIDGLIFGYLVD
jgi:hypothetical protein